MTRRKKINNRNNQVTQRKLKVIKTSMFILFLISATFLLFEINPIENTIKGLLLFLICSFIGWLLSIYIKYKIRKSKKYKILKHEVLESRIKYGIPMICIFLLPSISNFLNRKFASSNTTVNTYKIDFKGRSSGKTNVPYLFINVQNRIERLTVKDELYKSLNDGDWVYLKTRKGLFGYEIVEDITKLKSIENK